jgi:hypothetical protein
MIGVHADMVLTHDTMPPKGSLGKPLKFLGKESIGFVKDA